VPSFYALDVMRALTGRIGDFETLERQAEQASGARLAWPAPVDPGDAIDEMEHDLASLSPGSRAPCAGPGRAQYLLNLNEHLARSLAGALVTRAVALVLLGRPGGHPPCH